MRKIIATLLTAFGIGGSAAAAKAPEAPAPSMSGDLRAMVLNLSPSEIGLTPENFPHRVWGVVMETGLDAGYYTLVVLADGSTSLYFSTGGGIIGAGEHSSVREASTNFIGMANKSLDSANSASAFPPPNSGNTVFYFLTFNGTKTYTAPEIELGENRDSLSNLFHAGHVVIAAVRQTQSQ